MFAYNSYYGKVFVTDNVIVVKENQTVQQVLDSITNASETNKYLVLVPSGHELEYFDWKPNVEVKFLDNLDERWRLDELEGWDDLSNWAIGGGFQAEVVTDWEGNQIKLTFQDGYHGMYFRDNLDLRKYQGILFRFKFPVTNINAPTSILTQIDFTGTNAGHIKLSTWANMGVGSYDRYLFLPFNVDSYDLDYVDLSKLDWSSIRLRLMIGNASNGDELYLSDFKLVRTFPYPCILLRTDDSYINNLRVTALKEFVRQKIPAMWAIIANQINQVTDNNDQLPSPGLLHELQQTGLINIVNHSFSHPNFKEISDKDTLFQVESSRFIFERLGLKDALKWWVNPYGSTNPLLEKTLKEFGYMSVYSHHSGIPIASNLAYPYVPDNFQPLKKGGIVTLLFHATEVDTEEHFNELMNKVNNLRQYCRFVSLRDIERLMNNSHEKFSPRQTKPTLFQVLDSDFDMYFYHKQLFLDPNGTDRNINVQPYELRPGDPALIVNTGSTGNLIFDSSGLNLTIQPGQSANVIYDGDQWRQI